MNRKIAAFWNKYEGWVAPLAMALFLWAGLVIGLRWGASEQAGICAATIQSMNQQIVTKDDRIQDKDGRLRELQDAQTEAKDETIKAKDQAAEAAKTAAMAAAAAAEAAKTAAQLKLKGDTE